MGDADFSSEELAEDRDGFTSPFPRIKIPAGGVLQFELPPATRSTRITAPLSLA